MVQCSWGQLTLYIRISLSSYCIHSRMTKKLKGKCKYCCLKTTMVLEEYRMSVSNHLGNKLKMDSSQFGQVDKLCSKIAINQHKLFIFDGGQGVWRASWLTYPEISTKEENEKANIDNQVFTLVFLICNI